MRNRIGESRRIRQDWVTRPFSMVTKIAPKVAVLVHLRACEARWIIGTRVTPRVTENIRIIIIMTDGAFSYILHIGRYMRYLN